MSEWIVVTPGSKGEDLIKNLQNFECIKTFFIYCKNPTFHQNWANNYKKIGCLTSDPKILCKIFIEINQDYIIPNFNYNITMNQEIASNLNIIPLKNELDPKITKIKDIMEIKNKSKNKYNNFCIKLLNYFKSDESKNVFKNAIERENSPFYLMQQIPGLKELLYIPKLDDLRNATLLSLYFSKSPYLLNLLSQQEIKEHFKLNDKALFKKNSEIKLNQLIEKLCKKIMENKCILDEKNDLKEIQITLINLINPYLKFFNMDSQFLTNYYQIFNYFREIDFCLKVCALMLNNFLNLSKKIY